MNPKRSERAIMQENRRSTNRQTMRLPLERAWVDGNPVDAVILDLSVAGVLLETPVELKVGDVLYLRQKKNLPEGLRSMFTKGTLRTPN